MNYPPSRDEATDPLIGPVGPVGILGAGHFGACLIEGLLRTLAPSQLLIARRGNAASALSERFGIRQADNAAGLLRECTTVILAVRSEQAMAAVTGLRWRAQHLVISVCASVPLAQLAATCAPAKLVRALPLSTAVIGRSPTTLFPDCARARSLLERLGPVIALDSEAQFEIAAATACTFVWAHTLIDQTVSWAERAGMDATAARGLVAECFAGAGTMLGREPSRPIGPIVAGLATPGGLSEQGLRRLDEARIRLHWDRALDAAFNRARGIG